MIVKLFEVRDSMTFIPVMAVKLTSEEATEHWLIRRAGFDTQFPSIQLTHLNDSESQHDPYAWKRGNRTMPAAHRYIEEHFDSLSTGDVVDVEFILGLSDKIKRSERGI